MRKRITIVCMTVTVCAVGLAWFNASAAPPFGRDMHSIPGSQIVSGTVSYRERVELPQSAMVHVELIDLLPKDPRKAVIGEDTIWPAGMKLPVTFRIPYDPSRIDPLHIYAVRARITDGEKTLFISGSISNVLTKGASNSVDVVVVPASIRY